MASIIPGYEYDIFISYRHNDNHSGWVTIYIRAIYEDFVTSVHWPGPKPEAVSFLKTIY